MDTNNVATIFTTKSRFLSNSRRVFLLTRSEIVSLEGGTTVKMRLPFKEIQQLGPHRTAANWTLKTSKFTDTYIQDSAEQKAHVLVLLMELTGYAARDPPRDFLVIQLKPEGEIEVPLRVSSTSLSKSMKGSDMRYSSRYLVDIEAMKVLEGGMFRVEYTDGSKQLFRCAEGTSCDALLSCIQKMMHANFNHVITPTKASADAVSPRLEAIAQQARLYGVPIKKYSRRQAAMVECLLCLTAEHLCICRGSAVLSRKELKNVISIHTFQDSASRFSIQWVGSTKDAASVFEHEQMEHIVANIFLLGHDAGASIRLDLSGVHRPVHIRRSAWIAPDFSAEEHFLARLISITGKDDRTLPVLQEFNWHMIHHEVQSKDKRQLQWVLRLLRYTHTLAERGQENASAIVIHCLLCLEVLLRSRVNYGELSKLEDGEKCISDTLRSSNPAIACTAARLIFSLVHQPEKRNTKEGPMKVFLLHDETINLMLSILVAHSTAKGPAGTLLVTAVLEIFMSVLKTHADTTDKEWYLRLLPKISRPTMINTFFQLCSSQCIAVAYYSSVVLRVIMRTNSPEVREQIQDSARQNMALLYHIMLTFDSPLPKQRRTSAQLVGLMCEGNKESMFLIERIFPRKLLAFLKQPKPDRTQPKKRWGFSASTSQKPQYLLKLNWALLFSELAADHENPELLWNDATRSELAGAIRDEMSGYYRDSMANRDNNKVWNHEEFDVKYRTLEQLLPVGHYYVGLILRKISDCKVDTPVMFLANLFHHLLLETVPRNRTMLLQCMTWCAGTYKDEIGAIHYIRNIIRFLEASILETEGRVAKGGSSPEQEDPELEVLDWACKFLLEAFKVNDNTREFIRAGGLLPIARLLPLSQAVNNERLLNAVQVLIVACRLVDSTDARGFIKIPIPRAKSDLCSVSTLAYIVQGLAAADSQVVTSCATLLELLLNHNSAAVEQLHKQTGVLYFICHAMLLSDTAQPEVAKLLQVIHKQQSPNLLRDMLPDSMAYFLSNTDAEVFARVFVGVDNTPEVIWTGEMRDQLKEVVVNVLHDFMGSLGSNPQATFKYRAVQPIKYKGLEDELRCGNYYIKALLESPTWEVEEPEDVLRDALKMLFTVPPPKQVMLLKAMCVLYKKYYRRTPFRIFEGFPTLLKAMEIDREKPDLSEAKLNVIKASTDVVFLSAWASKKNRSAFLQLKGLSCLSSLLYCFARNISSKGVYEVLVSVLKIVARLLDDQKARDEVVLAPGVVSDVLSCLNVSYPPDIAGLAMQCSMSLAEDSRLCDMMYKNGAHYFLLEFMLAYRPGVKNENEAVNESAIRASTVMGCIAGIFNENGEPLHEPQRKFRDAARTLLSNGMINDVMRSSSSDAVFLEALQKPYETPNSLWNSSTREETIAFVKQRLIAFRRKGSTFQEPDELDFKFKCLESEVVVGNVFLRIFNQNPQWQLDDAEVFLGQLFHAIGSTDALQNVETMRVMLISVSQVLSHHRGLERVVVTADALGHLFSLLQLPTASVESLQSLALGALVLATANQQCIDPVCDIPRLRLLGRCVKNSASQRTQVLNVFDNMISGSAKAVANVTMSGVVVYLLEMVTNNSQTREHRQIRALATQTLRLLKASSLSLKRKRDQQSKKQTDDPFMVLMLALFPPYVCAMLDRAPTEFVTFYDANTRNPDLIWDDLNRDAARSAIIKLLGTIDAIPPEGPDFQPSSVSTVDYTALNRLEQVGAVYVKMLNDHPTYRLHNTQRFLTEAVWKVQEWHRKPECANQNTEVMIAIKNVISNRTEWTNFIGVDPPTGLQLVVDSMRHPHATHELLQACTDILAHCAHAPICRKKMVGIPTLFATLAETVKRNPNTTEVILQIIFLLVKSDPAFITQASIDSGIAPMLLAISKDNSGTKVGNVAFAALKSMFIDKRYGENVRSQMLGEEEHLAKDADPIKPQFLPRIEPLDLSRQTPVVVPFNQRMNFIQPAEVVEPRQYTKSASTAGLPGTRATMQLTPAAAASTTSVLRESSPDSKRQTMQPSKPSSGPPPRPRTMAPMLPKSADRALPEVPSAPRPSIGDAVFGDVPPVPSHSAPPPPQEVIPPTPQHPVPPSPDRPQPAVVADPKRPPPPPPSGGPPPPPPAPSKPLAAAPAARSGATKPQKAAPTSLLSEIHKGAKLRHVKTKTPEERKAEREAKMLDVGGGGSPARGRPNTGGGQMDMMGALASALAQRRKKIVIDLAANPFEEDGEDDEWDE